MTTQNQGNDKKDIMPNVKEKTERPLTIKQAKFKSEYMSNNGNGVNAARKAGYGGENPSDNYLARVASENVRKCNIRNEIDAMRAELTAKVEKKAELRILSRLERQAFWSKMIESVDVGVANTDRLRASELLGRSDADFTDNIANSTVESPEQIPADELDELRAIAKRAIDIKLVKLGA